MTDNPEMVALHATLQKAYELVLTLRVPDWPEGIGSDTAFAIGEAAGILSKAKALVGRDIDDARRQQRHP